MVLSARLTELDAVNKMLQMIGEAPVSSLSSGLGEAAIALSTLRDVSRTVQMDGWAVNTWRKYELTRNSDNKFVLGVDVLKIDTVASSKSVQVQLKKSADGNNFLLWDPVEHRETWPNNSRLFVDIVFLMEFSDLNPQLQNYIVAKASHRFQKGALASSIVYEFTNEEVDEARRAAEAADSETEDTNVLKDCPSAYLATYTNNQFYGY